MAKNFPYAPDFNPGSQQWRRDVEKRLQAAEDLTAQNARNQDANKRATDAGISAAASLASKALGMLSIDGGDTPTVTAVGFAYFTKSGYPAAGLNISWTYSSATSMTADQAASVRYEVWIRPTRTAAALPTDDDMPIGPDPDLDSQRMTATPNMYTTVRGLECNTQYAIKVQVVSVAGPAGDYSDEVLVTTPNEGTQIPAGSFSASGGSGYAKLTWTGGTPSGYSITQSAGGADIHTPSYYFTGGVQAADGKVYFAESYNSNKGHFLKVDPVAKTSTLVQGSATVIGYWTLGSGMLGPDGKIYFLPNGSGTSEHHVYVLDPVAGTVTVPTVTGTTGCTTSVMHGGLIYAFRGDADIFGGPATVTITVIDPVALTSSATTVNAPTPNGGIWTPGGAVVGNDGRIYFGELSFGGYSGEAVYGVFDPSTSTASFSTGGATPPSGYPGASSGVLTPSGQIYFIPDASGGTFGGSSAIMILNPATGNVTFGPDVPDSLIQYGASGSTGATAFLGTDGCIYYIGQTSSTSPYPTSVIRFDPVSGTYSATTPTADSGTVPYYTLGRTSDGGIVGVAAFPDTSSYSHIATNLILYITSQAGTLTPNYLKYMQMERLSGSGWVPVNTLSAPGTTYELEQPGRYTYRMVPVSTSGTRGAPSPSITVTIGN